jgi:hypothetical protein
MTTRPSVSPCCCGCSAAAAAAAAAGCMSLLRRLCRGHTCRRAATPLSRPPLSPLPPRPPAARVHTPPALLLGADNLLVIKDPVRHAKLRALLAPAFAGDAVAGYLPAVQALASRHLAGWAGAGGAGVQGYPRLKTLTFDFILQVRARVCWLSEAVAPLWWPACGVPAVSPAPLPHHTHIHTHIHTPPPPRHTRTCTLTRTHAHTHKGTYAYTHTASRWSWAMSCRVTSCSACQTCSACWAWGCSRGRTSTCRLRPSAGQAR